MNTPPFPTFRYSLSSPEFQQIILAKSQNFVGREFIFTAIDDFLHRYHKGYFTIVGVPGSGKSAILAQYVRQNPHSIYYNAQVKGKNRVEVFLQEICTQLSVKLDDFSSISPQSSPPEKKELLMENATEGSFLFSLLLQQVSDKLSPDEKLIIIIDALDAIDINNQPVATNLFYLPRYLPNQVYFIFSRRPYQKSHSGLLIEAPSQFLDLSDYPAENQQDIKTYMQRNLTPLPPYPNRERGKEEDQNYSPLLIGEGLGERSHLIGENEDNFMYVYEIVKAINEGFYSQPDQINSIPPNLEAYYQEHWQKIQGQGLSDMAIDLLRFFTAAESQPMSIFSMSEMIKADVYDVMEIIENWLEFLQETRISKESQYTLYHHSFRDWLAGKIDELSLR
ncbi:MAG TPA: AAA family ATPase [Nostocaceae cyanobacterium]|nr:AAA family ATPase [Nostocaceae cyanobacterium]